MHIVHTEAHLFSVPNDCLWYDKLWGPSQRVVTLFILYPGLLRAVHTVWEEMGVRGFFVGLAPRLVSEHLMDFFFLQTFYFFRSERAWCQDLLGLLMRRQCSGRKTHCDDYLSSWCQCESLPSKGRYPKKEMDLFIPMMSMWKLPSKKNKYLLVQSALRNQTIKSPYHIPSELPLLVELAPFQREFGKMSDSDDDECCPELVEEDLSKVGNKNFFVFLEKKCLLSVSCKSWRINSYFEVCSLNNILIGSSHCNYWPTWLR